MSASTAIMRRTPVAVMRRLRYRLGARLLRPLANEMLTSMDRTPAIDVPSPPAVGAPDTFRERQEWAKKITERDTLTQRIRWEKSAIAGLLGLASRWPIPGWEQRLWDSMHDMPRLHPFSSVYNVEGLDRAAERIAGLQEHNRGLHDLVHRIFGRFVDEMPDDLRAEIEANLGMRRQAHVTYPSTIPDEGWEPRDSGHPETPEDPDQNGSSGADDA